MHGARTGLILTLALALAGAACGDDDKTGGAGGAGGAATGGGGAGGTGAGGTGAGGTGAGGTGGSSPGACNFPKCLADLAKDCTPMGACTTSQTAMGSNVCYANGVKYLSTFNMTAGGFTVVMRVTKPNGSTCFSAEVPISGMPGSTIMGTYKNANGMTIATFTIDQNGNQTVTCTGGQPVMIDSRACGMSSPMMGMGGSGSSDCMQGSCM